MALVGTSRCDVSARQRSEGGTSVVWRMSFVRSVASPDAALGDADGAARRPYLGPVTHDVYLNESACWNDIPAPVWDYTIGGYQVIKKWLSYREFDLLGRALTPDEAREVTHMARRIAALILLQPELDRNYQVVKADTVAL